MSETQLAESNPVPQTCATAVETNPVEVAPSAEYVSVPPEPTAVETQPVGVVPPTAPQMPVDGKWHAVQTGIITVGVVITVAILVFGTQNRNLKLDGTSGRASFKMDLSRSFKKAVK